MTPDDNTNSITLVDLLLCVIVIVMMRGCYHVGSIAEKVNPEEYSTEPLPDPDPSMNGLHPLGSPFIGYLR